MKKILLLLVSMTMLIGSLKAKVISTNYRNCLVFAYSQVNSVYEDENIELRIYNEHLWARNKSQKTIFIDLEQCFLYHNGASRPIWQQEESEKDSKKSKKEKNSKAGYSDGIGAFLTIAPNPGSKHNYTLICPVTNDGFFGNYSTTESPSGDFSDYDKKLFTVLNELIQESLSGDSKGKECIGTASRHLTEDESINQIGASIAYSFNKKTEDWNTINISTWVSDVIFAPYCVDMPTELKKKEMRGFGIKETEPAVLIVKADSPFETIEETSPIIIADWEGNFKKGTFMLSSTLIPRENGKDLRKEFEKIYRLHGTEYQNRVNELFYKKIIQFDGTNADWGKMYYMPIKDSNGYLEGSRLEQKSK